MSRKNALHLLILLMPLIAILACSRTDHPVTQAVLITQPERPRLTVAVIPLDSRPPCTQFVTQLADIADIRVVLPPPELLGHYKTPANKNALKVWLKSAIKEADVAIISTDMLIHGGLLASRISAGTSDDVADTLALLEEVHSINPNAGLYAFNIIPRLLIADNHTNSLYQSKMLKFSLLKDQTLEFENPLLIEKLNLLESNIPPEVISRYITLNEANVAVNHKLIDLVQKGVLAGLILGQDDGQPFGLPNISKSRINRYLKSMPEVEGKVFVTRGTDEVALTLLGQVAVKNSNLRPKVFVQYSSPSVRSLVMPFMPHSIEKTVEEKIAISGAVRTDSKTDADFIIYIHAGTQKTTNRMLFSAVREIGELIDSGHKVALVDLSEDFYGHETLFPYLVKYSVPVHKLIAYAGWNTTSNSIGTAITQATIFNLAVSTNNTLPGRLRSYKYNLEFLTARFLDDWYYQKDVQPIVKTRLHHLGIDENNLADRYAKVGNLVSSLMNDRANEFRRLALHGKPIIIDTDQGPVNVTVESFSPQFELPWERIFELRIKPQLSLTRAN